MITLCAISVKGQILINEVCSGNNTVTEDLFGKYADWFELYNAGSSAVDLAGYTITNSEEYDISWVFPSYVMAPGSHLTVFCSENEFGYVIDHIEYPFTFGDPWRYQFDPAGYDPNWMLPSYNDAGWPNAPTGIGIPNDGIDTSFMATYVDTTGVGPIRTMRFRKTINLTSPSSVSFMLMDHLFDDGFVMYVNGQEVDRFNVLGDPPGLMEYSVVELDQIMWPYSMWTTFIDASYFVAGPNVIAIEVHDTDPASSISPFQDIYSISHLTLCARDATVQFGPATYLCDKGLHTDFNLSSDGQELTLTDASGTVVDRVVVGPMNEDHSRGRYPDGGPDFFIFDTPTPCGSNPSSTYTGYAETPVISPDGGWLSGPVTITISQDPNPLLVLKWSNDGNDPDAISPLYTGPLTIDSTVVIRARNLSTDPTLLPSEIATATFFLDTVSLPVVSLTTDPYNLWNVNDGIYVFGPGPYDPNPPYNGANFTQGWERPAHVEYFDKDKNMGLDQDCKINIHGNFSKSWPQKSFRFIANDDFGEAWFRYDRLFPNKTVDRVKSFNVRNAGIDWNTTHFRDGFINLSARGMHMEFMDFQPCVLYVNGDYFGVYGLRERQDEHYLARNNNVLPDQVDLLRFEGDELHGSSAGFFQMVDIVDTMDLTIQENFDYVSEYWVDPVNMCDYFIVETFYANIDWIGNNGSNNIKFWRTHSPQTPWRYILWDTDLGLNFVDPFQYQWTFFSDIMAYSSNHIRVLSNLLANAEYENYFINRYADMLNTRFHPNNTNALVDEIVAEMSPEMDRHFTLWGQAPIVIFGFINIGRASNTTEWMNEVNIVKDFLNQRPQYAFDDIESYFGMNGQVDVTLNVDPPGAGTIKISTIVPDSLPWTGVYYDGNPVRITAQPNVGYSFSHWLSTNTYTTPNDSISIRTNVAMDDQFTAYFEKIEYGLAAHPNPSNDLMTVIVSIPVEQAQVTLSIYDMIGNRVADVMPSGNFLPSGHNEITMDLGSYGLSQGIYILSMTTGDFSTNIKIIKSE